MNNAIKLDVLAFSPHPDDAEMGCGGLLLKLKDKGYRTGIVDLTLAELSTNGDLETRARETEKASEILGLDLRDNLELEDGNITNDRSSRTRVIEAVRKYRPGMVLMPYRSDRHPDHENSYKLLKDAIFISGLVKFRTGLEAFRPHIVISYMLHDDFSPSFVVDISDYYKKKIRAVSAYKSQFYSDTPKIATHIASEHFFNIINSRHQCMGLKVKALFGEPYYIENSIKIDDPLKFFGYLKI
jgi:N-acetylglucosamine malate deacetylase 1